jgi:glycosyltransferase involved in cell wall biosynthesis
MSRNIDERTVPRAGRRVSVGIAAFNAEANIREILRAVSSQRQEQVTVAEIIVHSDHSTDGTIAAARESADPRLRIVDSPEQRGFAASAGSMLAMFTGDALVLLNDDIRIQDDRFIEKIAMPIFQGGADFAGANLEPLPPRTFVERASVSVFRVWERIRESLPQRDNVFTCDGAAMCLSARFARSIKPPSDPAQMGNVDAFFYFTCLTAGYRYAHAVDAVAYYRSPASLGDYLSRNSRNDSQRVLLERQFGSVVAASFRVRPVLYWRSVAVEAFRNPLVAVFVFIAGFYIRFKAQSTARNASATWEVLQSSKRLD